ncbi:MAG: iron ABC transporter permease, partial [Pseudomonadota bacterium]
TVLGVGIAFGLAGELVQSLLRNPLASPDIIGFTAGAGFGAVLSVVIVGTGAFVLPGAVAGGAVAAAAVLVFSWQRGVRPEQLVLTGIAVSLTVSVLTDLLITRLDANSAADLVKWLIGSFGATTPSVRLTLWGGIFLLLPLALWHQFALARVSHGGELAQSQGIDPRRNRLVTLCLAVALVALAVASAGPLPFVAFVSGPIAHGLNRAPRPTLFTAALVGSAITLLADMASRSLPGGFSLPAGIFTALIGAPVLLWVLYLQSRKAFP